MAKFQQERSALGVSLATKNKSTGFIFYSTHDTKNNFSTEDIC